ncbi:phosphatidylethanolamine-binding protein 4 [Cheilinus undulatus]|uniref:phosphatidylethanolamine-binding protein 4 n=1 Tax=Cheilinus undulatus TaxID=241271 RepID=UPI001BD6C8C9|nr:phosphatidylethanolamine-binding protein 4 [Cheilinus undulatus]
MAVLAPFLVLCACVLGFHHAEAAADTPSIQESSYCHDGLEVKYPELDVKKCLRVEWDLRKKLTTVWKAPQVKYSRAKETMKYVLVMIDPDAPSHTNPTGADWRHWLVVNIQGKLLKNGEIQGKTLTEYRPPSPPRSRGFHRYQFMLYEQPPDKSVFLTEKESSHAKWSLSNFVTKFGLGKEVAAVQLLTQHYED